MTENELGQGRNMTSFVLLVTKGKNWLPVEERERRARAKSEKGKSGGNIALRSVSPLSFVAILKDLLLIASFYAIRLIIGSSILPAASGFKFSLIETVGETDTRCAIVVNIFELGIHITVFAISFEHTAGKDVSYIQSNASLVLQHLFAKTCIHLHDWLNKDHTLQSFAPVKSAQLGAPALAPFELLLCLNHEPGIADGNMIIVDDTIEMIPVHIRIDISTPPFVQLFVSTH
jgi:hypothetical protein